MHLDYISGEKYALYFHNLLSENVDNLPFISFYDDFSVSLENRWNATLLYRCLWWLLWTLLSCDHGSNGRCGHPSYWLVITPVSEL